MWVWFLSPQPLPGRVSVDESCGPFTTGGDGVLTTGGGGWFAAGGVGVVAGGFDGGVC